jgi:hypothetical protein
MLIKRLFDAVECGDGGARLFFHGQLQGGASIHLLSRKGDHFFVARPVLTRATAAPYEQKIGERPLQS